MKTLDLMSAKDFKDGLMSVMGSCSLSYSYPMNNRVRVNIHDKKAEFVATDGYHIIRKTFDIKYKGGLKSISITKDEAKSILKVKSLVVTYNRRSIQLHSVGHDIVQRFRFEKIEDKDTILCAEKLLNASKERENHKVLGLMMDHKDLKDVFPDKKGITFRNYDPLNVSLGVLGDIAVLLYKYMEHTEYAKQVIEKIENSHASGCGTVSIDHKFLKRVIQATSGDIKMYTEGDYKILVVESKGVDIGIAPIYTGK